MFERFTPQARSAVVLAQEEARRLHHHYVGTEHLLLGVLREPSGAGARALDALGVGLGDVRADVVRRVGEGTSLFADADEEALRTLGIDLDEVRRAAEETFGPGALERRREGCRRGRGRLTGHIPVTPRSKKALELALREALRLGHSSIGTEHLLLGLVRDERAEAARILVERDATPDEIRRAVVREIGRGGDRPGRTA